MEDPHFSDLLDARPYAGPRRRRVCLVTAVRPKRALSQALAQHLSAEMPSIEFTLTPRAGVSAVWVCGYEAGAEELVRTLRAQYPTAWILATGRGPSHDWGSGAIDAGADYATAWPVAYGRLEHLLGGRPQLTPLTAPVVSPPRVRTAT